MVAQSKSAIDAFLNQLSTYRSESVFNPWAANCEHADAENSFSIRRENLRAVLCACAAAKNVDVWIGRDLGWRGGRRTGVALVDEMSLTEYAHSIEIPNLAKATAGPTMRERTATEVHLARARVSRKVFFWNVFPFHPHEMSNAQSNRMHTPRERKIGLVFLEMVLSLLPAERLITIGNDATNALSAASVKCYPVRHPSYGGQKEFHSQIDAHYGLLRTTNTQMRLFET